jgi:hypothetical protein
VLPWRGAQVNVSVLDPNETPTENGFKDAFDEGILLGAEGRVTIKPFVLVGHQLIGFMWSNEERTSLIQDPSNLARLLITPDSFPRLSNPGPVLERILERFSPDCWSQFNRSTPRAGAGRCTTSSISTSGAHRRIRIEAWGCSSVSASLTNWRMLSSTPSTWLWAARASFPVVPMTPSVSAGPE